MSNILFSAPIENIKGIKYKRSNKINQIVSELELSQPSILHLPCERINNIGYKFVIYKFFDL